MPLPMWRLDALQVMQVCPHAKTQPLVLAEGPSTVEQILPWKIREERVSVQSPHAARRAAEPLGWVGGQQPPDQVLKRPCTLLSDAADYLVLKAVKHMCYIEECSVGQSVCPAFLSMQKAMAARAPGELLTGRDTCPLTTSSELPPQALHKHVTAQ